MKTTLVLAALLASSVAAHDGTIDPRGNPANVSEEERQSFFKNPNATGTYTFEAYDVSERFPPNETVGGWKATIQVANITGDPEADKPYLGIGISFQAPEGMELPTTNGSSTNSSSNYGVCMAYWGPSLLGDGALDDAQDDDGDCTSFLSDECIEAFKAQGAGYYWDGETCASLPNIPEACDDSYSGSGGTYGVRGKSNNSWLFGRYEMLTLGTVGANLSENFNDSILVSRRSSIDDEESVMTQEEAYKNAVRGVWTVLINWGVHDRTTYSPNDVLQPSLLCLRAKNVTRGSEDPNAGSRTSAYGLMSLFFTLFALAWLV
ncbi:hypothetical protein F66182_4451 [Fusarium sp. NRRL 66182]|nr:hypothetical protein F66182_4451 [Fusarium sp. NRRL 66182]